MSRFNVFENGNICEFLIEESCFPGIRLIAQTVSEDLCLVTGQYPQFRETPDACRAEDVVLMASAGRSRLLEELARDGLLDSEILRGRRESFLFTVVESPFPWQPRIRRLLVIAGSDKRGTVYGMFHLSRLCGVSPLVFFGDAKPERKTSLTLTLSEPYLSKEPSVIYRGFFINDEWPAFGNWCQEKYGGANAQAYRRIFELLLRLRGNYLWPAMWNSSFWEDGPGLACAKLADTFGVIMGTSHHEPMCRAGVEWQNQYHRYGEDSSWSFLTNAEAIKAFWKDGIERVHSYENVITIGMRGENDSKLLPEGAGLTENIGVIKKAVLAQHEILRARYGEDLAAVPRMLAIYKEVEDYYYGDDVNEGLKDWDELRDVIFLLSDDNYGHLRALPAGMEKEHRGGYGMYFHFDYHGSPVSYEWINCNRLTRTWEQMTKAYEAGVRKMWIVNVGDLKGMEYPLCYFLDLAFDFETWESTAVNQTETYLREWIGTQFGSMATDRQKEMLRELIEGYTRWNACRSPESMQKEVYHPFHYLEGERIRREINSLLQTAEQLKEELTGAALDAYLSMFYYPAVSSMNLILMYLDAGENTFLAQRGCIRANSYAEKIRSHVRTDENLTEEFHRLFNGKWNHMMRSAHTGFRSWDDRDWLYPTAETVFPLRGGKVVVGFRGSDAYHLGAHWQDKGPLISDDLTSPDKNETVLDIDSRGDVSFSYELEYDVPWLLCRKKSGRVETGKEGHAAVCFSADRTLLHGTQDAPVTLRICFDNKETTFSRLLIRASAAPDQKKWSGAFLETQGYCSIRAEHFEEKADAPEGGYQVIDYLGREGGAIRTLPVMQGWTDTAHAPYVGYRMIARQSGQYKLRFYLPAANPSVRGGRLRFALSVNGDKAREICGVSADYYTEWFNPEWAEGVLRHAHIAETELFLSEGLNTVRLYALDSDVIIEKMVFYPADRPLPESCFGPAESFRL